MYAPFRNTPQSRARKGASIRSCVAPARIARSAEVHDLGPSARTLKPSHVASVVVETRMNRGQTSKDSRLRRLQIRPSNTFLQIWVLSAPEDSRYPPVCSSETSWHANCNLSRFRKPTRDPKAIIRWLCRNASSLRVQPKTRLRTGDPIQEEDECSE